MRINGAAFFKQSFELKIKGDLIPEAAAEEIIGELQALFARHRNNFKLGMLNFEFLQLSDFQLPLFLPVVPVAASVKTKLGGAGRGRSSSARWRTDTAHREAHHRENRPISRRGF